MAKRPKLLRIDDEMRRWCAALEEELSSWPDVKARPMFGLIAYHRGPAIFAAVPRTRAVETDRSILIKLPNARSARLARTNAPGASWVTFELTDDGDVADALRWLGRAYEKASSKPARK
jgi:hypothetical protein